MPRVSDRIRLRHDDGIFRVTIFARADHDSFRIEYGFRGSRPAAKNAGEWELAVAVADGFWAAYQEGAFAAPVIAPATMAALKDALCEREGLALATRRSYRGVWKLLLDVIGPKRDPKKIYPSDIKRMLVKVEGNTHDSYLRTLRATLQHAVTQGWIVENPTIGIPFIGEHKLGPWMPSSEWPRYLAACTDAHAIRSGFVLETGLRAGEIAAARDTWIVGDIGRRAIKIDDDPVTGFVPKGGPRSVPLTDRAEEWLRKARAKWGPGFIFSATGLAQTNNFARMTADAVKLAKVTPTDFHGLRRSCGAHWLDCQVTMFEVSRLLGHADITTTQRWYAALSDSTLVAAIAHVEAARRGAAERQPEPAKVLTIGPATRSPKRSPKTKGA